MKKTRSDPICKLVHTYPTGLDLKINFKNKLSETNIILHDCIAKLLLKPDDIPINNFIGLLNCIESQLVDNISKHDQIDSIKNINVCSKYSLQLLYYNIVDIFFKELDKNKKSSNKALDPDFSERIELVTNSMFYIHRQFDYDFEKYVSLYNSINTNPKFNPYKNKNLVDCIIKCKNMQYVKHCRIAIERDIYMSTTYAYSRLHDIFHDLTNKICIEFNLNNFEQANVKGFVKFITNRKYINLAKLLFNYNIQLFGDDRISCNHYFKTHKNMYTYSYIYFYFVYSNKITKEEFNDLYMNMTMSIITFYTIFNKLLNILPQNIMLKLNSVNDNDQKNDTNEHKNDTNDQKNNKYDYFIDGINSKYTNKLLIKNHKLMIKYANYQNDMDMISIYLMFLDYTNYILYSNSAIVLNINTNQCVDKSNSNIYIPTDSLNYNHLCKKIKNWILYDKNYIGTIEYKNYVDLISTHDFPNYYDLSNINKKVDNETPIYNTFYINDNTSDDYKLLFMFMCIRHFYYYRYHYIIIICALLLYSLI